MYGSALGPPAVIWLPAMRTSWLLLFVVAAACEHSTPPAAAPPAAMPAWSDATFAANVRAVLAKRYPGSAVDTIEEDRLRVRPKVGDELEVSFAKAHAWCRDDWASCAQTVDRTLAAMAEADDKAPVTRAQLRVVLRANEKVANVKARAKAITVKPFSSDAQWLLAADLPDMVRLDVAGGLLGMSDDDAWRIATDNVKPGHVVTQATQGFIVYQDDYAPSALLYPALLVAAAHKQLPGRTGNLLAAVPEENVVLYTIGGANEAAQLRDAAAAGSHGSKMPLSGHVMEWTGSAWREAL